MASNHRSAETDSDYVSTHSSGDCPLKKDTMGKSKPFNDNEPPNGALDDFDDDDGFAEDECTLDFDDDEDGIVDGAVAGSHTLVYREYYGEDFSRYLEDDPVLQDNYASLPHELSQYNRPRHRRRNGGKERKKVWNEASSPEETDQNTARSNRVKNRLSQVLTLGRSRHKNNTPMNKPASIHNFSYSHTKIGLDGASTASSSDTNPSTKSGGRYAKNGQTHRSSRSDYGTTSMSWWKKHQDHIEDSRQTQSEIAGYTHPNVNNTSEANRAHSQNSLWRRLSRTLRKKHNVEYMVDDDEVANNLKLAESFEDIRL